ncbi:MAG: choline dehydrogenase, partial [Ilumatobacteraceae bacterium]
MTSTPLIRSTETVDFVIVGAGSAGCVLANRLTEDPSVRVLLLEAGPQDTFETIQVPALFSALFGTEVDWNYQIEEQNQYRGSTTYPRGKTLGGSSSINLMVYIRGHRADFDGWSERGNVGWDYDTIDPAYYTHPADLADITAGLRVALEIANQSPISKYLRCLNLPIEANPSDEALTEHARHW